MIVLDTTVLVYAVGVDHPLREPCRSIVVAVREGHVDVTTSVEVVQEFTHVRSRRYDREDAVRLAREYAVLLSPLFATTAEDLSRGLEIYERHTRLGTFDAVLAAAALEREAEALVSADDGFDGIPGLRHVDPGTPDLTSLLG